MCRRLGGFLVGFVLQIHWMPRPAASAVRQQSRSAVNQARTASIPKDCRERMERCPQVRKSAPIPVHG